MAHEPKISALTSWGTRNSGVLLETDVSITDDAEIAELNERYRGKARPTDVLSFAQNEGDAFPETASMALGDIVISLETALRQARERNHSLLVEMQFLAVHGALHLLGWDHGTASQRRAMWKWQDEITENLKRKT